MSEKVSINVPRAVDSGNTGTDSTDRTPRTPPAASCPTQVSCDFISKPAQQLLRRFGAKLFEVRRPSDGKHFRVIGFSGKDALQAVEPSEKPLLIVPFPGCAVPQSRKKEPTNAGFLLEHPGLIPEPQERRVGVILETVAKRVAESITPPSHLRLQRRHFEAALLKVIPAHCDALLKASTAMVSNAREEARREAAAIRKKVRKELADDLRRVKASIGKLNRAISKGAVAGLSICREHRYRDVPLPMAVVTRVAPDIPNTSGIYFVWDSGRVVYVGQSTNLANRCKVGHPSIRSGESISWLEFAISDLDFAEWFYMGILKPERNGRTRYSLDESFEADNARSAADGLS